MSTADLVGSVSREPEVDDDVPYGGSDAGSDGEDGDAVDLMGDNTGEEDSSEEDEEDDSEEERKVREGFIVEEDESSTRRRKKKRRKDKRESDAGSRKRRKDSDEDEEVLDEDDLELLAENLGGSRPHQKLKRLRRRRSNSSASDRSDQNLQNIFDDDRAEEEDLDENLPFDADEMAGFIEDDTQSESSGRHGSDSDDEDTRETRREKKKKQKKTKTVGKARGRSGFGGRSVEGITAEAWQEVTDVFGNGQDYAFALEDNDDEKEEKELKHIFEPSEISIRMLTEGDDAIRALDIPERMQLASVGLPHQPLTTENGPLPFLPESELDAAARWMSARISARCNDDFVVKRGDHYPPLYEGFMLAVKNTLRFMNIEFLEVPFIWHHRSDFLVHFDATEDDPAIRNMAFLAEEDLWRISSLSVKYRALFHRKNDLRTMFDSIRVEDRYFEDIFDAIESVEDVSDVTEWISMKYSKEMAELKQSALAQDTENPARVKRASKDSQYINAKSNVVAKLAELVSISATELSQDFVTLNKTHFKDDPEKAPLELAEEYATEGAFESPDVALAAAKMILVHEIWHDPILKKEARRFFRDYAVVSVTPTEKGIGKIDEMHPFYAFKYLLDKPVALLYRSAQFLQILSAESEGLVTCKIQLPAVARDKFMKDLSKLYMSDYTSSTAEAWNAVRLDILEIAVNEYLMPAAASWTRNLLQDEEEDFVGRQCATKLSQRVDATPFYRSDKTMDKGDVPSVLALSHGAGDPKRDSIVAVFLDQDGHFREHLKIDNLDTSNPDYTNQEHLKAFSELLRRRRPQVIVVGGFSSSTRRLMSDIRANCEAVSQIITEEGDDVDPQADEYLTDEDRRQRAHFESIFVYDDVARIYQNSNRAAQEFPELSKLGKYCMGLARYAQSPLNEYAALGSDLDAITYDPNQKLLRKEKLMPYLHRALVTVTNKVGVDINKAIRNPYYCFLLPYVAGLGPRKADGLVRRILGNLAGTLTSRTDLVVHGLLTKNIFMNTVAFLRIPQDDLAANLGRNTDDNQQPDILDDTRIHPEDYEVARKMAGDAMEYDEEDLQGLKGASQAVADVMEADPAKLDDLSLDDFAAELYKILGVPKRLTLYRIRDEMQAPYAEARPDFAQPTPMEVWTMLTGETPQTLERGLIIPVRVIKVRPDESVLVRLDSGIEVTIAKEYRSDNALNATDRLRQGSTLQALVIDIRYDMFEVELSTQEAQIQAGDLQHRRMIPDGYFDRVMASADKEAQMAVQQKGAGRQRRIIKHPNFHNFTSSEAEEFLAHRVRGDCVIRPSSKEDHLAVTWKVDDGIYQHIAVHELNKPNEFSIGSTLRIQNKWSYSDLDELISLHVNAMHRKVEQIMASDKFKGSPEQLTTYLANFTMANPDRSAYGFAIDHDPRKGGQFVVMFRASAHSEVLSWPVKIVPGAFSLLGEEHGDVVNLCNAFKTAYISRAQSSLARQPPGATPRRLGMTPNPYGARTPNPYSQRTPNPYLGNAGGRTPLVASGRMTPNPYAQDPPTNVYLHGMQGGELVNSMAQHYSHQQQWGALPPQPNHTQAGFR